MGLAEVVGGKNTFMVAFKFNLTGSFKLILPCINRSQGERLRTAKVSPGTLESSSVKVRPHWG